MKTNDLGDLYNQAKRAAEARGLGASEVREISEYSSRLFTYELPLELCTEFRLLCHTAVREPRPPVMRSHRPVIGPVIVFLKHLSWRILKVLLKDTIESQQTFNRKTVRILARSLTEVSLAVCRARSGE